MIFIRKWVEKELENGFKVQEEIPFMELDNAKNYCISHGCKKEVNQSPESFPHFEIFELDSDSMDELTKCYFVQE